MDNPQGVSSLSEEPSQSRTSDVSLKKKRRVIIVRRETLSLDLFGGLIGGSSGKMRKR